MVSGTSTSVIEEQYSKQESGIDVIPAGIKAFLKAFAPEKQLSPIVLTPVPPDMDITTELANAYSPKVVTDAGILTV